MYSLPSVSIAESIVLARHKSVKAHRTYICATDDTEMARLELLYNRNTHYRS